MPKIPQRTWRRVVSKGMSEAELQFKIASALSSNSIPFRIEFQTPVGRLDIAIADDSTIWGIVECKLTRKNRDNSFQLARYRSIGVPLLVADPSTNIDALITECSSWLKTSGASIQSLHLKPKLLRRWRRPKLSSNRIAFEACEETNIRDE